MFDKPRRQRYQRTRPRAAPKPKPEPIVTTDVDSSIRDLARKGRRLVKAINKEDHRRRRTLPIFGMTKLKGPMLDLYTVLKEDGHVRTSEEDVTELFRKDSPKLTALMDEDLELSVKTAKAKVAFLDINNKFRTRVVAPLETAYKHKDPSKLDYVDLRRQAEKFVSQARHARRCLKKDIDDARRAHLDELRAQKEKERAERLPEELKKKDRRHRRCRHRHHHHHRNRDSERRRK